VKRKTGWVEDDLFPYASMFSPPRLFFILGGFDSFPFFLPFLFSLFIFKAVKLLSPGKEKPVFSNQLANLARNPEDC
jgi:hypothetical protein